MKVEFNYGTSVLTLPSDVRKYIKSAGKNDVAVLLALTNDPAESISSVASVCGITESEVVASIAFWRGAGIIASVSSADGEQIAHAKTTVAKAPTPKPYTMSGAEIERICTENPMLKTTVEKCQTIFGKVFGTAEYSVFIYLYDHLRLDCEYILLLCSYCKRQGHDSVRYFEKTALNLFDRGIDSTAKLEKYFIDESRRGELEFVVRRLYGMGERSLTATEKEYLRVWTVEWDIDAELVEAGYEEMMKNINFPKMSYENKILKNWYDAGVKTVEDAKQKSFISGGKGKAGKSGETPSFDLGEFFDLAVMRGKAESKNK